MDGERRRRKTWPGHSPCLRAVGKEGPPVAPLRIFTQLPGEKEKKNSRGIKKTQTKNPTHKLPSFNYSCETKYFGKG